MVGGSSPSWGAIILASLLFLSCAAWERDIQEVRDGKEIDLNSPAGCSFYGDFTFNDCRVGFIFRIWDKDGLDGKGTTQRPEDKKQ